MAIKVRTIDEDGVGRIHVLVVSGHLTIDTDAPKLRKELTRLLDADARRFILDLARVSHMDSAALGETVACKKRALECGATIKLVMVPEGNPDELFRMTMLDRIFDIFPDEAQARTSFRD